MAGWPLPIIAEMASQGAVGGVTKTADGEDGMNPDIIPTCTILTAFGFGRDKCAAMKNMTNWNIGNTNFNSGRHPMYTTTLTARTKWLSRPVASCLLGTWLLCGAVGCASDKSAEFLFVQTADRVTFQGDTMIMHGVSPTTLFFSDRPERIMGHQDTLVFVDLWSEGDDSFAKNPPNAALTILGDDESEVSEIVVELQHPKLVDGNLSYEITVLDGTPPETGGVNALFIDAIVITDPGVVVVHRPVIVAPAYGAAWYRAPAYGAAWYRAPAYGAPWYRGQTRRVARRTARRVSRRR